MIIRCKTMAEEPKPSNPEIKDKITQLLSIDTAEDENIKTLVSELTNSNNIETKTDLNIHQITVITDAIWFAKRYGIQALDLYVRKVELKLLVSKDRGGRTDLTTSLLGVFGWNLKKQENQNVKV